ncbi:hypothetical protein EW145_g3712 [Phellinidium pouzarii]|uniref:Uncharacterized protein n=1 Tax=Phellinidium pouzarii TaxID=167371 RepID=A0A4S4LBD6_9AGAM|nr:hypothetical protein EW145_g3712 [Phellinidium pouzarii]
MVGIIDPNPSKQPEEDPEVSLDWVWDSVFTRPIKIKRPAQGKFSPKTDERCFTWCSQSVRGRFEGRDPRCRSLCIRRVFEHEVKQLTTHFSLDSRSHVVNGAANEYPLPPEGQPSSAIIDGAVGGVPGTRSAAEGVRYWKEGWYIWMTKNRWAAQEKMDLMMFDLDKQTAWMRTKEQEERAWAEKEAQIERERERNGDGHVPPAVVSDDLEHDEQEGFLRHPYPNAAEESFLIRVPTKMPPLDLYAQQVLAPTRKVLGIVETSFKNGDQKELALRTWDLVQNGVPFTLVKNVIMNFIENWRTGPKDVTSACLSLMETLKKLVSEIEPHEADSKEALYTHIEQHILPHVDANECPPLSVLVYAAKGIIEPTFLYESIPTLLEILAQIEFTRSLVEKQAKTALALNARYTASSKPGVRILNHAEKKALKKIVKDGIRLVYLEEIVLQLYRLYIHSLWISPKAYILSKTMRSFFPSLFVKSGDRLADEHWQGLIHHDFSKEERERVHDVGEATKVFLSEAREWDLERMAYFKKRGLSEEEIFGDGDFISYPQNFRARFPCPVDENMLIDVLLVYMGTVEESVDTLENLFPADTAVQLRNSA